VMLTDFRIDEFDEMRLEASEPAFLARSHHRE
jgi:hypothetical protein